MRQWDETPSGESRGMSEGVKRNGDTPRLIADRMETRRRHDFILLLFLLDHRQAAALAREIPGVIYIEP